MTVAVCNKKVEVLAFALLPEVHLANLDLIVIDTSPYITYYKIFDFHITGFLSRDSSKNPTWPP
jgi:hypothetical protein